MLKSKNDVPCSQVKITKTGFVTIDLEVFVYKSDEMQNVLQ